MFGIKISGKNSKPKYHKNIPKPKISNVDDILVETHYSGINPVDYKVIAYGSFLRNYVFETKNIIGFDFSGRVIDVGSSVRKFKKGDLICGLTPGSYAQYCIVKEDRAVHIPKNVSMKAAGCYSLASQTVWRMYQSIIPGLDDKGSKKFFGCLKGKSICVIGASGGCGIFAVLVGKYFFGAKIFGVSSKKNHEFLTSLGVDVCIDYKTVKFESVLKKDKNVYGIVDCFGGKDYSKRSCIVLQNYNPSYYTTCGAPNNEGTYYRFFTLAIKKFWNFFGYSPVYKWVFLSPKGDVYETILRIIDENNLEKLIPMKEYKLEQIEEAHKQQRSQRTVGKLVFKVKKE